MQHFFFYHDIFAVQYARCVYIFFFKNFFFFSFLFNFIACADLFKRSRIPKFFFFFLPFSLTVHFTQSSSNPLLRLYNLASRLLFDHPSTLVSILGTFCDPLLQSCLWSTREFWTRLFCIAPALLVSARIFFFFLILAFCRVFTFLIFAWKISLHCNLTAISTQ